MRCALLQEIASFTDLEEEEIVFAAEQGVPPMIGTRSDE